MVGILDLPTVPFCKECHENTGEDIEMEMDHAWSSALGGYVSSWRCPQCDHEIMRDDTGDGPTVTTPDGERF